METLGTLFGERQPDDGAPLLVTDDRVVTYGDADARSGQWANLLVERGVRPGDRVAVQVEKSVDAVCLYLACLRGGFVFVPMNPSYTGDEVGHVLHDAEPALFVSEPIGALVEAVDDAPSTFVDHVAEPDTLAAILYTSGTTGKPKGVMLTHQNLASNAAALRAAWGFGPTDVLLHALPLFHVHGLFVALHTVIANGTGMVFLPRFDVDSVLSHLPDATVFMGVPTYYTRLLADDRLDRARCRSMRLFVSGSAPLSAATHQEFEARTGHRILERYGMTETGMLTSNPLDGERRPGSVGLPLPGVDVRITHGGDREEEVGDVEVRGSNVFGGYWRRPELTASEFTEDGFFRTGDLGTFDADGYLHLVGRSKDLIISGGLNVYPKEVEEVLDDLPGVIESAVVGVPDADFGEAVVAALVVEAGAAVDAEFIRAAARERLAPFKVPKRVVVLDELPRNAMGKVAKAEIRARRDLRNES